MQNHYKHFLSVITALSCFGAAAASAGAATTTSYYTCLADRIAAGHQIIYFRFPESVWGPKSNIRMNAKKHHVTVSCYYYPIWGNKNNVDMSSWFDGAMMYAEDTAADDLYYFDITAFGLGELEEGADYGIWFKFNTSGESFRTCDLYLNSTLLGHTFQVDEPPVRRENPFSSADKQYYAGSDNGVSRPLRELTND